MEPARLVEIVLAALDTMDESEFINFVAKHINAKESLALLDADDPEAFLDAVETFCQNCLNKEYYTDDEEVEEYFSNSEYEYYYYDDERDYSEYYHYSQWAKGFSELFRLAVMYIQSGDIKVGYEANSRLLSCLSIMMSSEIYLGTDEPMSYISIDWNELFELHYDTLFQYHTQTDQAIEKAFRCWVNFSEFCTERFLHKVEDITIAERIILDGIKSSHAWEFECRCFNLLEQLYTRLDLGFDKVTQAELLTEHDVFFYFFVVEGLSERAEWRLAAQTARIALEKIPAQTSDSTKMRIVSG